MRLWISAFELGCFYGLLALGYLLVIEGARFFNFLIGAYAMCAAMLVSWLTDRGWNLWLAIAAAVLIGGLLGATTEVGLIRPIQKRSENELSALVAVTAGLLLLQQAAATLMGRRLMRGRKLADWNPIRIGSGRIQPTSLILFVTTIVLFCIVSVVFARTNSGRTLRAVGDNEAAALMLGLPVRRVRLTAFVVGGVIASMAGILFAAKTGVSFQSAFPWTISSFLAIVVGGTGSAWSPLAGGLVLGIVQVFVPRHLGSQWLDYALFGLALIFFAFRPQGIFARRVRL